MADDRKGGDCGLVCCKIIFVGSTIKKYGARRYMAVVYDGDEIIDSNRVSEKGISLIDEGEGNKVIFSDFASCCFSGIVNVKFKGNGNVVRIAEKVGINRGIRIIFQPGGPGAKADGCSVSIGKGTYFNGEKVTLSCEEENTHISIGENCLLAGQIIMKTSDGHRIFDVHSGESLNPKGDVNVGNHVWICPYAILLNHSMVSDNSVVGIRAVVTKKFNETNVVLGECLLK